jgi:hypothetical protein
MLLFLPFFTKPTVAKSTFHVTYIHYESTVIYTSMNSLHLNRTFMSGLIQICKQITHIVQGVYSVYYEYPTVKSERNDHERSILKFIEKVHVLYRVLIQNIVLLSTHE